MKDINSSSYKKADVNVNDNSFKDTNSSTLTKSKFAIPPCIGKICKEAPFVKYILPSKSLIAALEEYESKTTYIDTILKLEKTSNIKLYATITKRDKVMNTFMTVYTDLEDRKIPSHLCKAAAYRKANEELMK
jgi:hypothetical protein